MKHVRFRLFFIVLVAIYSLPVWGQTPLQPLDENIYQKLDRFDILFRNPTERFTSVKATTRGEIGDLILHLDSSDYKIGSGDRSNLQWLANANNHWLKHDPNLQVQYLDSTKTFYTMGQELRKSQLVYAQSKKPIFKVFYKSPAHFFEVEKKDFYLRINPLLQFRLAKANGDDKLLFENQRGVSIHGGIDEKIYFHTAILESQARYPDYVNIFRNKFNAIPGAGFLKTYQSRIFDFDNGVDYLLADAHIGVHVSRHVNLELGHGRHFLGNGIRSLFLSDFSTNYFYLKLNTKIWKFQYQNIFGELTRPERKAGLGDQLLPKKYFAAHYLSINILPTVNIGLFETVVFARENQFELQYLNPVILYRTVEGSIGSPDNVLLGLDVKWNILQRASVYSQFVLDEFKISEITAGNGWWANKYGWQLGLKYLDLFGVDQFDAQVEYNIVRPYTYSHNTGIANYSHYNQALAHPLGANFRELMLQLRFQPGPRWTMIGRVARINLGEDIDTINWGSNLLLPNNDRPSDFGHEIGQGTSSTITLTGLDVSYEIKQGLFLDVYFQARKKTSSAEVLNNSTTYLGAGFRWNLGRRWLEF